jgi:hypothetical protein
VVVLADGFAWNGQIYDSLTKIAFAITGTRSIITRGGPPRPDGRLQVPRRTPGVDSGSIRISDRNVAAFGTFG